MTKIKVTIDDVTYEFDSIEEAEEAFPNINRDMNAVFDKTDRAFELVDEAFDMVDDVFKSLRKFKRLKRPDKPKSSTTDKPNIKVPPEKSDTLLEKIMKIIRKLK